MTGASDGVSLDSASFSSLALSPSSRKSRRELPSTIPEVDLPFIEYDDPKVHCVRDSLSDLIRCGHKESESPSAVYVVVISHTFGTPSPCCLEGILVSSSAIVRYNGSGRHGYTSPRPQCTPRLWWRTDLLGIRYLSIAHSHESMLSHLHPSDSHRSIMWLRQMAQ